MHSLLNFRDESTSEHARPGDEKHGLRKKSSAKIMALLMLLYPSKATCDQCLARDHSGRTRTLSNLRGRIHKLPDWIVGHLGEATVILVRQKESYLQ